MFATGLRALVDPRQTSLPLGFARGVALFRAWLVIARQQIRSRRDLSR